MTDEPRAALGDVLVATVLASDADPSRDQALRAILDGEVTVDAAKWWELVQLQSLAVIRQQCVEGEASGEQATLAELQAQGGELGARVLRHALATILRALDRANALRARSSSSLAAPGLEGPVVNGYQDANGRASMIEVCESIDQTIGYASARLLSMWHSVDGLSTAASGYPSAGVAAVVVNEILQHAGCGTLLPCHDHVLLESLPARASGSAKSWSCFVCKRQVSADGEGTPFRCAPCDVNVCRSCVMDQKKSRVKDRQQLQLDRFFALTLRNLHSTQTNAEFDSMSRLFADELHTRMTDVVLNKACDFAVFAKMMADVMQCSAFSIAAIKAPMSSHVQWIPRFMHTHMMAQYSLLGPLFRASVTPTDYSSDHAVYRMMRKAPRRRWTSDYRQFKSRLVTLFRELLDSSRQQPFTIDATMGWLSIAVHSTNKRRNANPDANDRLDGFLVNLSATLVSLVLPALKMSCDRNGNGLNPAGHQAMVAVRGYGDKDYPEVPLRDVHTSETCQSIRERETTNILELDRASIARYQASHTGSDDAHYYPLWNTHERVGCDACERDNFDRARYKCIFCDNFDICEACFERFASQSAIAAGEAGDEMDDLDEDDDSLDGGPIHHVEHAFFRVNAPIPTYSANHFEYIDMAVADLSFHDRHEDAMLADTSRTCSDCACALDDKPCIYKCSNCLEPRYVCESCLHEEERSRNPHKMHTPGHLYFALLKSWRQRFNSNSSALHFRSLLHPPGLLPRLRFDMDTELLYVTIRSLHFGPLCTLSKAMRMLQEARDLAAFTHCEEEQLQHQRSLSLPSAVLNGGARAPLLGQQTKMSSHYMTSKSRLNLLNVGVEAMKAHLLDASNVAGWLLFYARTCRWVLSFASPSQDPFREPLHEYSYAFSVWPEYFFFDVCDVLCILASNAIDFDEVMTSLAEDYQVADNDRREIYESLLVMLLHVSSSPGCSTNLSLRVQASRSFVYLVAWLKDERCDVVESVFQRCTFLRKYAAGNILAFHSEIDRLNTQNGRGTNLGDTSPARVGGGDAALWRLLPTRGAVGIMLRLLWQLPDSRVQIELKFARQPNSSSTPVGGQFINSTWGDLAKLMDEAKGTIATLRHLLGLADQSSDESRSALPFRPELLDGHLALHYRHLRLAMRVMFELIESFSWMASTASFRQHLLTPELVDQSVRVINVMVSWILDAFEAKEWEFSVHLLEDSRMLLAMLVTLVVRCAGMHAGCSVGSVHALRAASGRSMMKRLGDLSARVRWNLSVVATQQEEARWAVDGHTSHSMTVSGKRFMAALAQDGRFDFDKFVAVGDFLRREEAYDTSFEFLDQSWIRAFKETLTKSRELARLQRSIDGLLGEMPSHYLDPLLSTLMTDPVRLPSGNIVDRVVIERHLMAPQGGTDPFSRERLTLEMLEPCDSMREEICSFIHSRTATLSSPVKEDVLIMLGLRNEESEEHEVGERRGVKRIRDLLT